jgi:NAD dependent epimerase/dehydratase family enzyme
MSWISIDDEVDAILHALRTPELSGPTNLTALHPVTNAEFTRTLAKVLRRPAVLPTPLLPLKALYGEELVEHLLLASQNVLPARLTSSRFSFEHPTLEGALRAALGRDAG